VSLPHAVREGVEKVLPGLAAGTEITSASPVSGGCINNGVRIKTDSGASLFLKWNPSSPLGMFEAEADGLDALRACAGLRVPKALAWSDPQAIGPAWLLIEFVGLGAPSSDVERALGTGLAQLHVPRPGASFGWPRDNWIGSLPQDNSPRGSWPDFWREHRIAPQLGLARSRDLLNVDAFDRLLELIPDALDDVTDPSLIHGDLWRGNTFASAAGEPVVIDPAVYLGHAEVDLAMTELFGGFGPAFYEAYSAARPITEEYRHYRRDLYQLYYLLVHLNLFGPSYAEACRAGALRVIDALD